jgi:pimeloyl-ACP methyl ester carboxylesterase
MLHVRRLVILVPLALLTASCQARQSQSAPLPLPQEPGIEWDTGREAEPVRSDLPALITTGSIDPRTPASFARRLATGLSRAHVVIAPGYGHERPPDCIFAISRAFLDAPDRALDTTCVASIPPLRFFTGGRPGQ